MSDEVGANVGPVAPAPPRRGMVRRLVVLTVCLVVVWLAARFVGDVDWSSVWASLGKLAPWELGVLVGLMLVRATLNALPLALFIHGVGLVRALVCDLTVHLLSVVAPPPSDLVLRLKMFSSWGVPAPAGLAGTVANTIVFYTVRFAMPLVGTAILVATRWETGPVVPVLLSSLVSAAILSMALGAIRRESSAARVGLSAGRVAARVRPSVRPEEWSSSAVTFRMHVVDGFRSHLVVSMLGLVTMVLVDASMVVLALRFVGISGQSVPALDVYITFCLVYPFTLFPLMGLGIVDALLLAEVVDAGGAGVEAVAIAGLAVWRTVTLGGPVALGGLTLAAWRMGLVPPRRAKPRTLRSTEGEGPPP